MQHLGGVDIAIINPFTTEGLLAAAIVKVGSENTQIVPFHRFDTSIVRDKKVLIISSLKHEAYTWTSSVVYILENRSFRLPVCKNMPSGRKIPLMPMARFDTKPSYEMVFDFFFGDKGLSLPPFFGEYKTNITYFEPRIRCNFGIERITELVAYCSNWEENDRSLVSVSTQVDILKPYSMYFKKNSINFVKTCSSSLHPEIANFGDEKTPYVVYTEVSLVPKILFVSMFNLKSSTTKAMYIDTETDNGCTFFSTPSVFHSCFGFDP